MAYAAVTSLMETLNQHFLQSQPRLPLQHKQEIVLLHENLGFLQESLEKSEIAAAYDNAGAMKDLEAEMRDVLFKAEEKIETELSNIYLQTISKTACLLRLQGIFSQALKRTDFLKKKFIKIKSKYELAKGSSPDERITGVSLLGRIRRRGLLLGSTSSQPDLERENITVSKFSKNASKFDCRMVGCDEEFMKILDKLRQQSAKQLQVVSIVGMGGIGKTTLARKVYEHPSVTSHFDKRAWVTVSREYNVEQMLGCLIGCVIAASGDEEANNQDQLPERLRKHLKEQRYLIVMDDIWSTTVWDSVKRCFPDDNNGSRILLTSRLREVAEYTSSEFPFEFEQLGRDIVTKCKGLPLAITVVASLLSKTEELEKWKNFAENVSRYLIGNSNDACSRILYLSYNQLPHHLKACFLYFGVFREDYEIPVKNLVRLWAAEGFLRAEKHLNVEEVAMECLKDLVDRSLVVVSKQRYNGEMKRIRIHDLLRDLCLREARHENLLNVCGDDEKLPFHKRISKHLFSKPCRWISDTSSYFDHEIRLTNKCVHKSHSFYFHRYFYGRTHVERLFSHFKLLRVVDMQFDLSPKSKILHVLANLVHLRYLALFTNWYFPVVLFEHWNMQTFIVRGRNDRFNSFERASGIILKMPQLRNFYFERIFSLETSSFVYRNLENISWLDPSLCTKDLFTKILNLKKLGVDGGLRKTSQDCFYNFVQLGQLEKLSISRWYDLKLSSSRISWATSFLPNLKKLKFMETNLKWSDLSLIGMLANIEVLKLISACHGRMWKPSEGGFSRLKRLVIGKTDLEYWNVMGDHFPVLEYLELSECHFLRKIPNGFVDINTLALIRLNKCWESLLTSAKRIQDEQHSYGNDALLVHSEYIMPRPYSYSEEEESSDE